MQDVLLRPPVGRRDIKQAAGVRHSPCRTENERQEDKAAKQCIEKQDGNHRIASQRLFLEHIVKAQQGGGSKRQNQPHISLSFPFLLYTMKHLSG